MVALLWVASLAAAAGGVPAPPERPSCQYNIVSSTVVAAYCSHRAGDSEVVDLFIAWRGRPGWFQHGGGPTGGGGSSGSATGPKGRVTQYEVYNGVTVAFDADFDAGTVVIGDVTIPLKGVNGILIDRVERADARRISATFWIERRLPLGGDVNLVLARRSPRLRQFLRCDTPMPAFPAAPGLRQPAVLTVCDKLASRRR